MHIVCYIIIVKVFENMYKNRSRMAHCKILWMDGMKPSRHIINHLEMKRCIQTSTHKVFIYMHNVPSSPTLLLSQLPHRLKNFLENPIGNNGVDGCSWLLC